MRDPSSALGIDEAGTIFCREEHRFSIVAEPSGCQAGPRGGASLMHLYRSNGDIERYLNANLDWFSCGPGGIRRLDPGEARRVLSGMIPMTEDVREGYPPDFDAE